MNYPGSTGLDHNYSDTLLFTMLWTISVVVFCLIGLLIVMFISRSIYRKYCRNGRHNPSQEVAECSTQQLQLKAPTNKSKAFRISSSIVYYSIVVLMTMMTAVAYGFDKLGRTLAVKIVVPVAVCIVGILLSILWRFLNTHKKSEFLSKAKNIKGRRLVKELVFLGVWILFVGLLFSSFHGVCQCIHNDNLSIFSTTLTRSAVLKQKVCPSGRICRVYATLPETTDTSVFINVHTAIDVSSLTASLNSGSGPIAPNAQLSFRPSIIETIGQRIVWTFLFDGLSAETTYNVTVTTASHTILTQYKTLPAFGSTSKINIGLGGDVAFNDEGRRIFDQLSLENLDLLVIGGDITYDNGYTYCYYPWDNFYSLVDRVNRINQTNSRLVPIILSLGNHDAGRHGLSTAPKLVPTEAGPWWFAYNPQHFDSNRGIPQIANRAGHHYHKFGSIAFISLDSAYMSSYQEESVYLQNTASMLSSQGYKLMAGYHVPGFPSCLHGAPRSIDAVMFVRNLYQPIFIQYGFKLCTQNHIHRFKRTNPIGGVVYIGDGALGTSGSGDCPQNNRISSQWLATQQMGNANHYWLASVDSLTANLSARRSPNRQEFDSVALTF